MNAASRLAATGLAAALATALAIPALTAAAAAAAAASKPGSAVTAGSAASTASRHILAWGDNAFGQLGNGTTGSDTPVQVSLQHGTKVTAVRAGCDFSLALTSNGHVLAWGANTDGQLGDGTTSPSDTPVRVSLPSGTKVTAISAGDSSSLARTSKGHALAWGNNGDGQLGDGSTTDSDRPVRLSFPAHGHVTSLFAGCEHSLALLSSGTLLAWGDDQFGQLGDDGGTSKDTPVKVLLPAGSKVGAVAAGCTDSYALTAKGHVLAWGYNIVGELGDGSTTSSVVPVRVELPSGWRASAIGTGPRAAHVLAIMHRR